MRIGFRPSKRWGIESCHGCDSFAAKPLRLSEMSVLLSRSLSTIMPNGMLQLPIRNPVRDCGKILVPKPLLIGGNSADCGWRASAMRVTVGWGF